MFWRAWRSPSTHFPMPQMSSKTRGKSSIAVYQPASRRQLHRIYNAPTSFTLHTRCQLLLRWFLLVREILFYPLRPRQLFTSCTYSISIITDFSIAGSPHSSIVNLDSKDSPDSDAPRSVSQTNSIPAHEEARYDTSDLSEVEEPAVLATSPSPSDSPREQQSEFGQQEQEQENSESESEHVGGSEDGDYDLDDAPPTNPPDGGSSSQESPRPRKRKLEVDDDHQYMMANPELYGLRRSVRVEKLPGTRYQLTGFIIGTTSSTSHYRTSSFVPPLAVLTDSRSRAMKKTMILIPMLFPARLEKGEKLSVLYQVLTIPP